MSTITPTPSQNKGKGNVRATPSSCSLDRASYVCVHCNRRVSSLYITYSDPSNTSLLQCASCGHLLDVYTTLTFPVLLVDLLLFKPRVYRHLLTNRGSNDPHQRECERTESTFRIGAIVVGLDALIRCTNVGPPESLHPVSLYLRVLSYCVLETFSLHACIALSATFFQTFFRTSRSAPLSRLRLLPLTLFYTSLPTLFLLFIVSLIWAEEYSAPSSPLSPAAHLDLPTLLSPIFLPLVGGLPRADDGFLRRVSWLSRENLKSGVSTFGNVRGWANEALLRKGVGGSSAVVGVAVLLNASQSRTILILVVAWVLHLFALHLMDPYVS
ncbi:BQ2448_7712 [Microbotryum intermedium]|uniref:Protein ARV n=1 Tax=Microbotryum intermedium TaxID=269621 RepID=A0A238FRU5_9BASI|nr:BQ2448_7712 [Microbotryum intermedium]